LVTACKEFVTRKGDKMAFLQVEDLTGHAEVTVFSKNYASLREFLQGERPLLHLTATIDNKDVSDLDDDDDSESKTKDIKLRCDAAMPLIDACSESDHPVLIDYPPHRTTDADFEEFKTILEKHKGRSPLQVQLMLNDITCVMELGPTWKIQSSPQFHKDIEAWAAAH
ncbi:MAG: DNA polymerase III subunit alpha, partial [Mailhella sp.]|nr:DNA polymerase III subunit alpha [Mailhella sp.]